MKNDPLNDWIRQAKIKYGENCRQKMTKWELQRLEKLEKED
jgi:hypothetical protein